MIWIAIPFYCTTYALRRFQVPKYIEAASITALLKAFQNGRYLQIRAKSDGRSSSTDVTSVLHAFPVNILQGAVTTIESDI